MKTIKTIKFKLEKRSGVWHPTRFENSYIVVGMVIKSNPQYLGVGKYWVILTNILFVDEKGDQRFAERPRIGEKYWVTGDKIIESYPY
jgi:hypothetical protein